MNQVLDAVVARLGRRLLTITLVGAVVVAAGIAAATAALRHTSHHPHAFPQNAAMEQRLGIRFSRVAVVADGGLVQLNYVVLDSEKAQRFQADVAHPPVVRSESRDASIKRVALMKQGHALRAGQTYYFVYQNTRSAVRSGEQVTIVDGALTLAHAPVL